MEVQKAWACIAIPWIDVLCIAACGKKLWGSRGAAATSSEEVRSGRGPRRARCALPCPASHQSALGCSGGGEGRATSQPAWHVAAAQAWQQRVLPEGRDARPSHPAPVRQPTFACRLPGAGTQHSTQRRWAGWGWACRGAAAACRPGRCAARLGRAARRKRCSEGADVEWGKARGKAADGSGAGQVEAGPCLSCDQAITQPATHHRQQQQRQRQRRQQRRRPAAPQGCDDGLRHLGAAAPHRGAHAAAGGHRQRRAPGRCLAVGARHLHLDQAAGAARVAGHCGVGRGAGRQDGISQQGPQQDLMIQVKVHVAAGCARSSGGQRGRHRAAAGPPSFALVPRRAGGWHTPAAEPWVPAQPRSPALASPSMSAVRAPSSLCPAGLPPSRMSGVLWAAPLASPTRPPARGAAAMDSSVGAGKLCSQLLLESGGPTSSPSSGRADARAATPAAPAAEGKQLCQCASTASVPMRKHRGRSGGGPGGAAHHEGWQRRGPPPAPPGQRWRPPRGQTWRARWRGPPARRRSPCPAGHAGRQRRHSSGRRGRARSSAA